MWDVGCGLWDVGCGMWDVGCGMWVALSRHYVGTEQALSRHYADIIGGYVEADIPEQQQRRPTFLAWQTGFES